MTMAYTTVNSHSERVTPQHMQSLTLYKKTTNSINKCKIVVDIFLDLNNSDTVDNDMNTFGMKTFIPCLNIMSL